MNIRKLIEKALNEAREEFAAIVQRKLEELMGDAEPTARAPRTSAKRTAKPAASAPREGRRGRTPESAMAELRAKIIAAMPLGEAMKRAQVIERAGLSSTDAPRVANVLRRLKDEGVLTMRGQKATATYTRKS